jgi:ABC-type Na+ efflux pump, permease component
MLLVGFIPASFSLITALESFVGERERNSLEALLSMPLSDNALYLGKLISSLIPPLMSSFLAMAIFGISLRIREPDLFFDGLNFEYLVVVLLLILAKSVVMVAGAVIISSHTTSIRAANLLASFVLLPTAAIIQLEALLIIAQRWDVLWLAVVLLLVVAVALTRTGMGTFNREEILSREHEQLNLRHIASTFLTFLREYQPAGTPPEAYAGQSFSLRRFYLHELPALLHDYPCQSWSRSCSNRWLPVWTTPRRILRPDRSITGARRHHAGTRLALGIVPASPTARVC